MDCDVQVEVLERPDEQIGVVPDIPANHELSRMDLGL